MRLIQFPAAGAAEATDDTVEGAPGAWAAGLGAAGRGAAGLEAGALFAVFCGFTAGGIGFLFAVLCGLTAGGTGFLVCDLTGGGIGFFAPTGAREARGLDMATFRCVGSRSNPVQYRAINQSTKHFTSKVWLKL